MPVRTLAQASGYAGTATATTATTDASPRAGDVACAIAINDYGDGPPSVSSDGTRLKIRDYFYQDSPDSPGGAGVDLVVYTRTLTVDGAVSITALNPEIDSGVFLLVAVLSNVEETPAALQFGGSLNRVSQLTSPSVTGVRGGGVLLTAAGTAYDTAAGQAISAPAGTVSSLVTAPADNALARLAVDGSPPGAGVSSGTRSFALSPSNGGAAVSVLFEPAAATTPAPAAGRPGQMFMGS